MLVHMWGVFVQLLCTNTAAMLWSCRYRYVGASGSGQHLHCFRRLHVPYGFIHVSAMTFERLPSVHGAAAGAD